MDKPFPKIFRIRCAIPLRQLKSGLNMIDKALQKWCGIYGEKLRYWQRKQNANNNFSAVIPYDLEQQRKESKEFLDDLTI